MSDVSRLMSIINTEDKSVSIANVAVTVNNTTPQIIGLPTVAQGTSSSTRIGDSILVNRIDLELTFSYSGTAATATSINQHFRYWLVRYKKTPSSSGTTAFSITEFLNLDSGGNATPMSLPNTDTNENFQIMDVGEVEVILPTLSSATIQRSVTKTIRHNCHFHEEYNGSASTNICDNMTFLVVVAQNASNTGGASSITSTFRKWFIDN